jgi:hypothetical protein
MPRVTKAAKKAVPKKTVKKVLVEKEPTYTLTKEQYERLCSLVNWDNPLSNLDNISRMEDTTQLEIGFKVGIIYNEFEKMLNECSKILTDINLEEEEYKEEDGWISYDGDDEENN